MRRIYKTLIICAAFSLILFAVGAADAAIFTVNTTSDTPDANAGNGVCADAGGMCSLRAAISEANALAGDDTITLPAGTFTQTLVSAADENANAGGDWDIASNITINGAGASGTFIQAAAIAGTATERVIDVRSGTVFISGVTVRNGRFTGTSGGSFSFSGAGIQNLGNLTLNNVVVRDNLQNRDVSGGTLAGGIYHAGSAITINNSTVTANACNNAVDNCRGGGMYSNAAGTIVTVNNSHFDGNSANYTGVSSFGGFGAGFGATNSNTTINITDSAFNNNTATGATSCGLGLEMSFTTGNWNVNVANSTFKNNVASTGGSGAGVFISAYLGAVVNATFDKVSVSNNTGNNTGAGINLVASGGSLIANINNSAVNNNSAGAQGGGILVGNQSSSPTVEVTLNLTNSTVSGNSSKSGGGGLFIFRSNPGNPATANINFSTFANNIADSDNNGTGDGGGISANVASNEGTINLKNSVVADNTDLGGQAPDIFRTINSQGYNHIENTMGGIFTAGTGDITGTDPELNSLALNGGTTMNQMPASTSPVLNTIPNGTNDCGTITVNDQKGVVRPFGSACDKGATERGLIIVTESLLPVGRVGEAYITPIVADYGQPTYSYSVTNGSVPPGLTLQSDGTWTGIPTVGGIYNFTVQAIDSAPFAFGKGKNIFSSAAPNAAQKSFQVRILVPTSASVSISGRALTADGRGISNVNVYLTDQNGILRMARTGGFGYYTFENVEVGRVYILTAVSKRFAFSNPTQAVSVTTQLTDVDFIATSQ